MAISIQFLKIFRFIVRHSEISNDGIRFVFNDLENLNLTMFAKLMFERTCFLKKSLFVGKNKKGVVQESAECKWA